MPIGENLFTPTIPANNQYSNTDLNALGSDYASLYGHNTTDLIQRVLRYTIYDAAPQMYYDDLKILKAKPSENKKSDEFYYREKVFGRNAIIATGTALAGTTQTFNVTPTSTQITSVDMLITYPNNTKGTITNVDTTLNQITVQAQTGGTLPAVAANDVFAQLATVAADGENKISTYMRLNTVERTNFIQLFARATRFGEVELYKYKNSGTTDYLDNNRQEVLNQFRIDLSNSYWNGQQGEVTLADGSKAKTMGGIYPIMQAAGSPQIATTVANIAPAFEDAVLSTQFESAGATKFLYATPRRLNDLQNAYKRVLTRYTPDNQIANLKLKQIEMEGTNVVLVPVKRFEEPSCYPASFANTYFLIDQESITCAEMWGERMGDTLDRPSNVNLNTFRDFWVDGNMSITFNNPLASATIVIS